MDNDSCTGWTFFEDQGEKRWVFRSFSTICRHWCLSSASWTGNKCSTFLFSSFFDPSYFFFCYWVEVVHTFHFLSLVGFKVKFGMHFFSFLNINQAPFNLNVKWIWLSRLSGVLPPSSTPPVLSSKLKPKGPLFHNKTPNSDTTHQHRDLF